MTNEITTRPSYLGGNVAPEGAFAETLGFVQPAQISMDNDRFNVLDENGQDVVPPSLTIGVIMLWENDVRIYRPRNADGTSTYDPLNPTPPTCFSDNRITPSEGATQPQSELCANCKHSVWDQVARSGGTRPACDNRYKVACLVAGAGGGLYLLGVAPASRKAYEQYRTFLKKNNATPNEVITKLEYVNKQLVFGFGGWITENTLGFVKKLMTTDEPAMLVNAFDKPKQLGLPKPVAPTSLPQTPTTDPWRMQTVTEQWSPPKQAPILERLSSIPPATVAVPIPEPKRRGRPPKDTATSAVLDARFDDAPKGNGGGFGMAPATAPPASIQEALDREFGPR